MVRFAPGMLGLIFSFERARLLNSYHSWLTDFRVESLTRYGPSFLRTHRDLPIPSRMWIEHDRDAHDFGTVARKIWAGEGNEAKLRKELDARAEQMVASLRPRRAR